MIKPDASSLFSIRSADDFEKTALAFFRFQMASNAIYRDYCRLLRCNPEKVECIEEIPFMPVEFFKNGVVVASNETPEAVFSSSGTTGHQTSRHYVTDLQLYIRSFTEGFQYFYGKPENYCILALLPSYFERNGSSLVFMADRLIKISGHLDSGFYLDNMKALSEKLLALKERRQPVILLGVTYALLDLAETFPIHFPELIIMETGGMKGRRREMVRHEVHQQLMQAFGTAAIHSEYGMTELLSQAYSKANGIFFCPPWMKILIRDTNDPLSLVGHGKTGGINIIDLANLNSCSFIAVQDLGKTSADGSFEVLGRFDHSQVRGCNLLVN
ncbi:MAG: acyl transferase [Bacteroidales bacterium]|nr:acyl transferase [Bacteroidales bacterium]